MVLQDGQTMSKYPEDYACVLCAHAVNSHNNIRGCTAPMCRCMATQGEASYNTHVKHPYTGKPIGMGSVREGYDRHPPVARLAQDATPTNKFNHGALCSDLVRRLARSQALGWRQEMLVNELLGGLPVPISAEYFGGQSYVKYGQAKVQAKSFRALRGRLIRVGFTVVMGNGTVSMNFPEGIGNG